jgi:hypothetical protein
LQATAVPKFRGLEPWLLGVTPSSKSSGVKSGPVGD